MDEFVLGNEKVLTQPSDTCSKSTMETPEQCEKSFQSKQ